MPRKFSFFSKRTYSSGPQVIPDEETEEEYTSEKIQNSATRRSSEVLEWRKFCESAQITSAQHIEPYELTIYSRYFDTLKLNGQDRCVSIDSFAKSLIANYSFEKEHRAHDISRILSRNGEHIFLDDITACVENRRPHHHTLLTYIRTVVNCEMDKVIRLDKDSVFEANIEKTSVRSSSDGPFDHSSDSPVVRHAPNTDIIETALSKPKEKPTLVRKLTRSITRTVSVTLGGGKVASFIRRMFSRQSSVGSEMDCDDEDENNGLDVEELSGGAVRRSSIVSRGIVLPPPNGVVNFNADKEKEKGGGCESRVLSDSERKKLNEYMELHDLSYSGC